MKVNSTLALTLVLLSLMVAAGAISSSWGYAVGREALKGVTQPDSRPGQAVGQGTPPHRQQLFLLKENEVIKTVKAQMSDNGTGTANEAVSTDRPSEPHTKAAEVVAPSPSAAVGFPISSQDQGVTLEVRSAHQQNGYLLLNVSLQNKSKQSVQFLYSFMNVTDDQGRAFSANTEGLPTQLPPNSQPFSGTVSIPAALLNNAQTLSLTLTDYPSQTLQLQVSDIPVVR